MEFGPSRPQDLLRDSVVQFLEREASRDRVREVIAGAHGFDPAFHRALGDLGVLGILIPERFGGSELGLFEAALVAQELGGAVAPISFHSAAVLAPLMLLECAEEARCADLLPRWAAGESLASVVVVEPDTSAWSGLRGPHYAADGEVAETFLVVRGAEVFLVPSEHREVSRLPLLPVDETRRLCQVSFGAGCFHAEFRLPRRLSPEAGARCLQAAWIALAADTLGAAYRSIRLAVDYARERRQFGRVIGSFQAVKHLCAEMIADVDPVQSLLWYSAHAWDRRLEETAWLAPQVKAHAAEVAHDCVGKATQVFGGMGFTWECDIHLFFKRAGYGRQVLGRPEELRRLAAERQLSDTRSTPESAC